MNSEIEKDLEEKRKQMKLKEKEHLEFYHFLKDRGCILFETVVGSQAHGTNTPQSDVDKAFIYILPPEFIYGTEYREQLRIHKDYTGYEIRRFLELVQTNNPTVLELLYSPEDCVITKHPIFQYAIDIRDKVLSKRCQHSFAGYARKQIQKANGLEKMQNWEKERITRKEPIDFCYIIDETGYGTKPLKKFLEETSREQKFCGVSKIPNARDIYALFYDQKAHLCFSDLESEEDREYNKKTLKERGETVGLGYKGVSKTGVGENAAESNQLRLSSIPKGESPIATLIYNKDGYTAHCKDYASYQEWLENRNEQRWVDNKEHGQQYDGKNLMHCKRLLQIGREIAETGTIQIRRPNPDELQAIRKGLVNLDDLIEWAEAEMRNLEPLFDVSELPDSVDKDLINDTLIKIRKEFYSGNFVFTDENKPGAKRFVKRHGNLSEFQTMLRDSILESEPDLRHEEGSDLVEDYKCDEYGEPFRITDFIPTKNWVVCDGEKLSTENLYIYGLTEDKLTIGGGGDWQRGLVFDIVEHEDEFMCINEYTPEGEWPERISQLDFLKMLDIEVKTYKEYEEE
jgi:predicted nucleotidyltransferase